MSNEPAIEEVEPPDAIAFLVRDARRNVMGYSWRLWWGRTSFYMKPRYAPLAGLKVSMHGPDPRHGLPGFKVDFDRTALPGARVAGGAAVAHSDTLPAWFPGRPLANGRAVHVARIRHPWVMFHRGVPSAPTPTVPKANAVALVVRPPEQSLSRRCVWTAAQRRWAVPNGRRPPPLGAAFSVTRRADTRLPGRRWRSRARTRTPRRPRRPLGL
jgi:hypothetical protein